MCPQVTYLLCHGFQSSWPCVTAPTSTVPSALCPLWAGGGGGGAEPLWLDPTRLPALRLNRLASQSLCFQLRTPARFPHPSPSRGQIHIDVVSIGENGINEAKLQAFVDAVNKDGNQR